MTTSPEPDYSPALEVRSVAEPVAHAGANRGKLNFGSPGSGSTPHIAGEMLP